MPDQPATSDNQIRSTIKGINHIGISVSDLEQSVAFYQSATTLEVAGRQKINPHSATDTTSGFTNAPTDVAVMKGPNGYLELMQFAPSIGGAADTVPVQGPGVTHICYQSPSPNELYSKFKSLGGTVVSRGTKPVDLGGYGVYYAYIRDADNIMFEVEQLDEPKFDGPIWLSHVALVSPDLDSLVTFYENLLGVKPYRRANRVEGPRFDEVVDFDKVSIRAAWFQTDNMILELWQYTNPITEKPGAPRPFETIGYNKFAFEVADINQDYERLTAAGVHFLSAPVESQGISEVYGRDPDGNLFSLLQLAPDSAMSIDGLKSQDWDR